VNSLVKCSIQSRDAQEIVFGSEVDISARESGLLVRLCRQLENTGLERSLFRLLAGLQVFLAGTFDAFR
jgi:hypothetical protein